jgi:nicotinamide-nucleotide adenylyltransferase
MTLLLATRLAKSHALPGGVAVGILNEPTFVGKSRILHSHLPSPIAPSPSPSTSISLAGRRIKLSFLIGSDTLTRFFQASFYGGISGMNAASEEYFGMGSLLICGRRGEGEASRAVEQEVLDREEVRPWVEKGLVRMLESNQGGQEDISSTTIRTAIRDGDDAVLGGLVPQEIVGYIRREGLYTS